MKISLLRFAGLSIAAVASVGFALGEEDSQARELAKLEASAKQFVEAYNRADAPALAGMFLPSGEITLADGEVISGREAIEAFYAEILGGDTKPKGALEAGSVRFVSPAIAIEDGVFHVTAPSGEIRSHQYTAVQVQQADGSWLTASVRDSLKDEALPSEKMLRLEWLVGDWKIEKDGVTTWLSFDWSADGPYLDGRALTEEAGDQGTAATWRIGWDARREDYVSWGFDALGGHTYSEWTATETGWLIRSRGVTADGEINEATQILEPGESGESFSWTKRDQVIGREPQPDISLIVVKRPPAPATADTE